MTLDEQKLADVIARAIKHALKARDDRIRALEARIALLEQRSMPAAQDAR